MDKHTKVLVADGNESFCESLEDLLREQGYDVIGTACEGDRAAELLQGQMPDVLILDLLLPRRDGISILKELPKENRPKILLLSAFATDYIASVTASYGVDYLLLKPARGRPCSSGWRRSFPCPEKAARLRRPIKRISRRW